MTFDIKQLVLTVIDMQNGFLGQRSQHVLPAVVKLVQEFRRRRLPVIFTRFHNLQGSQYERLIGWRRLRSSPEIDLSPELQQYADIVIDKEIYSAFTPLFEETVKRHN